MIIYLLFIIFIFIFIIIIISYFLINADLIKYKFHIL